MTEDFYDVLGVSRDASEEEITRAYRKKAAQHHPDVSDDPDAEEQFKRIQKAKQVLTDEEKRRAYDRLGHERFQQAEKHGHFDAGRAGAGATGAGGAGMGDPFGDVGGMGGLGDIFEQVFGGGRRRTRRGRDIRTGIEIDLEEAYHGPEKQFTIDRFEPCETCEGSGHPPGADVHRCPTCQGQGQVTRVQQTPLGRVQQTTTCSDCEGTGEQYSERCGDCGGEGYVRQEVTLQVGIPRGIRDGQTLRMRGQGHPSPEGGRRGDLLIDISIRDHEEFERDGDDLRYRQPVTFPQAVFGDTVTVPTIADAVELEVPAGTQSGETFTVEGEGMPRSDGRGWGDLHVEVQVVTPTSLSAEEREALEAFAEAGGEQLDVDDGILDRLKRSL